MGGITFEEPISRGTLRSLSPRSIPPLERLGARSPLRARSGRLSSPLMSLSRVTIPRGKRLSLTLTSSPCSCLSHLTYATLASTVLSVLSHHSREARRIGLDLQGSRITPCHATLSFARNCDTKFRASCPHGIVRPCRLASLSGSRLQCHAPLISFCGWPSIEWPGSGPRPQTSPSNSACL